MIVSELKRANACMVSVEVVEFHFETLHYSLMYSRFALI